MANEVEISREMKLHIDSGGIQRCFSTRPGRVVSVGVSLNVPEAIASSEIFVCYEDEIWLSNWDFRFATFSSNTLNLFLRLLMPSNIAVINERSFSNFVRVWSYALS